MMSEQISGLLHGLLSRNANKAQPQTRAEKILALEQIEDLKVRAEAIAWQLKLQKIVDICALALLLLLVIFAGLFMVLNPVPLGYLAVCTSFLGCVGFALIKHVFSSS